MFFGRDVLEEGFGHSLRAGVAVTLRVAQQAARAVNEAEVHAPRVYAYTADVQSLADRLADAGFHLFE